MPGKSLKKADSGKLDRVKAEIELDEAIHTCVDRIYNVYLESSIQRIEQVWAIGEEVLRLLNKVKEAGGQESYTIRKVSELLSQRGLKRVSPTALSKAVTIVQTYRKEDIIRLCGKSAQLGSEVLYMLTAVPNEQKRNELLAQAAEGKLSVNDLRGMLVVSNKGMRSRSVGQNLSIQRLAARVYSSGLKRATSLVDALMGRLENADIELEEMTADEISALINTLDSIQEASRELGSKCLQLASMISEKFTTIQAELVEPKDEQAKDTGRGRVSSSKQSFSAALDEVEKEVY